MENEVEFEVEDIVAHSVINGILWFRVRWVGYSADEDTWEREDNLNCPQILKRYWDSLKKPKIEKDKNKSATKQKIELLQDKKPKIVFGACKINKRILYHVMFEDNTAEWISSPLLSRLWPQLLFEYLESKLVVNFPE